MCGSIVQQFLGKIFGKPEEKMEKLLMSRQLDNHKIVSIIFIEDKESDYFYQNVNYLYNEVTF